MAETASAHDSGDCLPECEHPDHFTDGESVCLWDLLGLGWDEVRRNERSDAQNDFAENGPVML